MWETSLAPEDRAVRRLVVAIAPDADAAASAWAWSGGGTGIPPLARYLLHAAKLRYELRVWRRDSQARRLQQSLDSLSAELRRAGVSDPAREELLRQSRLDAALLHADLRAMRQTVEIAADNLGRSLDNGRWLVPGGPFADDADLGRWLAQQLDDEASYLAIAAERAGQIPGLLRRDDAAGGTAADARPGRAGHPLDRRKNVFVVYGRDPARWEVFTFLRALGLRPLEWETLVRATRKASPFLSETVRAGLDLACAAVVVMTPEDVVHLHPGLREPREKEFEVRDSLQARPNVLLELGMALAAKPAETIVLMFGEHRPFSDIGGLNSHHRHRQPGMQAQDRRAAGEKGRLPRGRFRGGLAARGKLRRAYRPGPYPGRGSALTSPAPMRPV